MAEQQGSGNSGRFIGALIGGIIGSFAGPMGALKGAIQGYTIGAAFGDTQLPPGPRLEDVKQKVSKYGEAIPRLYGKDQLTGNFIWLKGNQLDERVEEITLQKSIFGDTTQTQYKYSASFAVLICEGTIDGVSRIWANDKLIYNNPSSYGDTGFSLVSSGGPASEVTFISAAQLKAREDYKAAREASGNTRVTFVDERQGDIRIYKGTLDQEQDPLMVSVLGANTPAYRGSAYIVFDNLQLSNDTFKNSLPSLRIEVVRLNTDEAVREGAERIFTAKYTAEWNDDTTPTPNRQVININEIQPGSIAGDTSTVGGVRYRGTLCQEAVSYKSGILHNFLSNTGTGLTTGLSIPKKTFNYVYKYSNGTEVSYLNQQLSPLLFQTHDMVNLTGLSFLLDEASYQKASTNLISERVVYPFPFDMMDSAIPGTDPFIGSIQNLPNWVIVARGKELQIGFVKGERLALWNLGLNLTDEFNAGNTPQTIDFTGTVGTAAFGRLRAVFLGGMVYIYMSIGANGYFPGVIRVDIQGLTDFTIDVRSVIKFPKNFITNVGGDSYIRNTTSETYGITLGDDPTLGKVLSSHRVEWNRNIALNELGYDYENEKLYTLLRKIPNLGTFNSNNNLNTVWVTSDSLRNIETERLYELDRSSLEIIDSSKYINSAGPLNSTSGGEGNLVPNTPLKCFRVYREQFVDFGYCMYSAATAREDSYYVAANGNSYLDSNILYSESNQIFGPSDILYNPIANIPAKAYIFLRDEAVNGNERSNFFAASAISFSTSTVLAGINEIQRQVVTLNGNPDNLFNGLPGIQVGELLQAELRRQDTISVEDDTNFDTLTTTIKGLSIKDRGPLASSLKVLQDAYLFDVVEKDYVIHGDPRASKSVVRALPAAELGVDDGENSPEIKITTPKRGEVPSRYYITYRSEELEYNTDTIIWQDPSVGNNINLSLQVPIVLNTNEAYNLVRRTALSTISSRQGSLEIVTSFKHSDLELGDFIQVISSEGITYTIRIVDIEKGRPGLVKIRGVIDNPINYTYEKEGFSTPNITEIASNQIASLLTIDALPYTEQQDGVGNWVGTYSTNSDDIFQSIVSMVDVVGENLSPPVSLNNITSVGFCSNALPALITEGDFDYTATLTFKPLSPIFGFATKIEQQVLASEESNTFFYGSGDNWEMIKIINFTNNSDGTITASGILRGYKGTTHLSTHAAGEYLVSANPGLMARMTILNERVNSVAVFSLKDPSPDPNIIAEKVLTIGSRAPLPPIKLYGHLRADGQFYMEWFRQARYGIEWVNNKDTTLDEAVEQYKIFLVDPTDDNKIIGEIIVDGANTHLLTLSEQTLYYGASVTTVSFAVAQYSPELGVYGIISFVKTI